MSKSIGIDLGGTNLKSGLFLGDGRVAHLRYTPARAEKGPERVVANIMDSIERLLAVEPADQICGIGIGSPGMIDLASGVIQNPPNFPGWKEVNLGGLIRERFELPVYVDNDANVAALAESVFGAGRESRYFALITLGTGVGCGIILENTIYHGATGAAGEFGHTVIKYDGPVCKCGQRGCIERYIGAQWIVERARKKLRHYPDSRLHPFVRNQNVSPKLITQLAYKGDALCVRIIQETGEFLGVALGSLINLLNLDLILIGGGISKAGPLLFDAVQKSFQKYSQSVSGAAVTIQRASLGENAGVIGAGQLVFENLLPPK